MIKIKGINYLISSRDISYSSVEILLILEDD